MKKRPSVDFMDKVQTDINISMRAILVDWLVEVSEEYRLVPDTLYLTVNYIDRYLSGNTMDRQRLQLLGVACMMIASKYEICPPQVEEFCYIMDNTYFKDEVFEMESAVLNFLKFELTAPTVKCFLRRFVRAAQGVTEAPSMQLECMGNYLAELSLGRAISSGVQHASLCSFACCCISDFLGQIYTFSINETLELHIEALCTIRECVNALQNLARNSLNSNLHAIREKYSQHKYKFVAKYNVPSIPQEYFLDISG